MENEQHSSGKTEHRYYEITECYVELFANIFSMTRMLLWEKEMIHFPCSRLTSACFTNPDLNKVIKTRETEPET